MRKAILPGLFTVVLLMTACGPYEGPVLNSSDPKRLVPCPKPAVDDRAGLSFDAMQTVLEHNEWYVAASHPENHTIDARKCKTFLRSKGHPMQRPKDECLDVRFAISSSGAVTIINPPNRRFYWKIEPDVREWVDKLELDYSQVRCYDNNELAFWQQSLK